MNLYGTEDMSLGVPLKVGFTSTYIDIIHTFKKPWNIFNWCSAVLAAIILVLFGVCGPVD